MVIEKRNRTLDNSPPPFPEDFGERLERLKEVSGLSWHEFAERPLRDAAGPLEVAQGRTALWGLFLGHLRVGAGGARRLRADVLRRRWGGGVERRNEYGL